MFTTDQCGFVVFVLFLCHVFNLDIQCSSSNQTK